MNFDLIADAIIELNNASPRLPRKDQIIEVLQAATAPPADGPNVVIGGAQLGASIVVVEDSRITTNGWHVGVRNGYTATPDEVVVAILDFVKMAIVTKRATPAAVLH